MMSLTISISKKKKWREKKRLRSGEGKKKCLKISLGSRRIEISIMKLSGREKKNEIKIAASQAEIRFN